MIVREGEKIVCSNGHICGSVTEDVVEGSYITSKVLRIKGGEDAAKAGHVGHVCAESGCGEVVTEAHEGRFKIHTTRGWVGEFS